MVVKKAVRAHGNEVRIIATGRCLPDILLTNEDVLRYANLPEKVTTLTDLFFSYFDFDFYELLIFRFFF